jgi:hypothetical protein
VGSGSRAISARVRGAHETGIYRYFSEPAGGEREESLVHFEALLVKRDGEWKVVMEYQKRPATAAEWEAVRWEGAREGRRASCAVGVPGGSGSIGYQRTG